jgi:hypothetical protein
MMEGCLLLSFSISIQYSGETQSKFSESVLSLPDIGVECDETSKEQSTIIHSML